MCSGCFISGVVVSFGILRCGWWVLGYYSGVFTGVVWCALVFLGVGVLVVS